METLLANRFPNAGRTAWLTQLQQELRSESAYESLRWKTDEGFTLEPYYTADSLNALPLDAIQAAQRSTTGWLNLPAYQVDGEKPTNALVRDALAQGADGLLLALSTPEANLSQLLYGIKLSDTPVFFQLSADTVGFIKNLQTLAPYQLKGGMLTDSTDETAEVTRLTADSPHFRTVCISGHVFHNAGATATQELAYTLASLADVYDLLTEAGLTIDQLVPKTMLSVSIGTSYFREIAKLRALRVLYNRLLSYYTLTKKQEPIFIHGQTSTFYDAAVTPYTNLLRATTEAMAGVIGGCDALTVHPYDAILSSSADATNRDFAERMARNVSTLLKEESYLDKVADPAAGAYYLENLTWHLAESAWALFLAVEQRGGLAKALADGSVQNDLERAYKAKRQAVSEGNVLVGVTKFRSDEAVTEKPAIPSETGLLPNRRLAQDFE
ncbi:methylmalonyl-CoA mutase family protein [Spirosoma koreense]